MNAYFERPPQGAAIPIVVSIPHTGIEVPESVAARFASPQMRKLPMTDWHLHKLYDFLPALGIATLYARFSRLAVDLNRPPDAQPLYPGRFETGLVPVETFAGEPIFREPLGADAIEALRCQYHSPYHARLAELLKETIASHGRVILIDAHSVASRANRVHGALTDDIYLGDRDGTTCEPWVTRSLATAFSTANLKVRHNDPYKGGYITSHYGQIDGVDAIQIEMVQRVYMNEDEPQDFVEERWNRMKSVLTTVFAGLSQQLERN